MMKRKTTSCATHSIYPVCIKLTCILCLYKNIYIMSLIYNMSLSEPSKSWMDTSSRTTPCVSPTSPTRTLSWREASGGTTTAGAPATAPEAGPAAAPRAPGCPPNPRTPTSLWGCWCPRSTSAPSSARREPLSATSPSRRRASECPLCLSVYVDPMFNSMNKLHLCFIWSSLICDRRCYLSKPCDLKWSPPVFAGLTCTARRMQVLPRSRSASTPPPRAAHPPAAWSWTSCTRRLKTPRRES